MIHGLRSRFKNRSRWGRGYQRCFPNCYSGHQFLPSSLPPDGSTVARTLSLRFFSFELQTLMLMTAKMLEAVHSNSLLEIHLPLTGEQFFAETSQSPDLLSQHWQF
jgi:hypothetical protein